jgi:hypothetical protein
MYAIHTCIGPLSFFRSNTFLLDFGGVFFILDTIGTELGLAGLAALLFSLALFGLDGLISWSETLEWVMSPLL